jgi:cation diffusion facilitator family transporter
MMAYYETVRRILIIIFVINIATALAKLGYGLLINIGVSAYEYILGKRLKSSILIADSMHTRSDIFASLGVILGLFAVNMGYPLADPVIALLICGLILLTGLEIVKDSSKVLLDKALGEDVESMIMSRVSGVRDVVVHLEPKDYCEKKARTALK